MKRNLNERVSFGYKGVSISANGTLGKVLTYSLAGLFIFLGIAAYFNATSKVRNDGKSGF